MSSSVLLLPAAVARSQRRGGEAPRQETAVAVGEADLPAKDRVLLEVLRETLAEEGLSDSDRNVIESAIDDTLQGRGDHALAEIEREALGPVEAAARSPETMTDEQALCVPRVSRVCRAFCRICLIWRRPLALLVTHSMPLQGICSRTGRGGKGRCRSDHESNDGS